MSTGFPFSSPATEHNDTPHDSKDTVPNTEPACGMPSASPATAGAVPPPISGRAAQSGPAEGQGGVDGNEGLYRLQLLAERPVVSAETADSGVVRVMKRIMERVETLEVPITEEVLVIESRRGAGRVVVNGREIGPNEPVEILLRTERPRVSKEVVRVEDVWLHTERVMSSQMVEATLRSEELVVDDPAHLVQPGNTAPST